MNNTEILIVTTGNKVANSSNNGYGLTVSHSIEQAIELIYQRQFDIIILDNGLANDMKTKIKVLSDFKNDESIFIESDVEDIDYSIAIQKGIRAKMMRNFGQFELHEKN